MLRRACNQIAVALICVLLGQPLAACVTPGQTMTEAEHDCCMKMASTCESSAMPMSHSCCKHAVSHQVAALSKIWRGDTAVPAVLVSEIAPAFPLSLRLRDLYSSDSPPGSPPKLSTVLRI